MERYHVSWQSQSFQHPAPWQQKFGHKDDNIGFSGDRQKTRPLPLARRHTSRGFIKKLRVGFQLKHSKITHGNKWGA
jgi:hypothetical protein